MAIIQEKLNTIKALEGYIAGSLKLEYLNGDGCKYSYLCISCETNSVRKYVFYSFTYDNEKNIEEQTVTSESCVDSNDLQSVKITDGTNDVSIINNALKTYPIETTEIRWTTDTDFNKGTHSDTQTISDGGGGVSLLTSVGSCYGCWHLNESSGTNAPDSSSNNRDGTLVNMEDGDWVSGKLNNCLQFDGTNEYVNLGDIVGFERTDSFSVEAWIKLSAKGIIISRNQWVNPYRGWYIATNSNGWLQFVLTNTWGTNQLSAYQDEVLMNNNEWHHFVITYDGSSSAVGVKFYIDGQLRTTKGNPSTLNATIQVAKNAQICGADAINELFTGLIDETIIYDEIVTAEKALLRWNSGSGKEWIGDGKYYTPGTYTSNNYDSGYPNKEWEKIFFNINLPTGTTATFKIRTSNDGVEWGDWSSALANGDDITADGKFIQWKSDLTTTDDSTTPKVYDTSITHLENRRTILSP